MNESNVVMSLAGAVLALLFGYAPGLRQWFEALEGFGFIGVDLKPDYVAIARARIEAAQEQARQLTLGIEQAA